MTKRSSAPGAIEGSEILIEAQNILSTGIPRLTITDEMLFPVKASRRATGTITRESDPKETRIRDYSLLDLGDQISGRNLWGFSSLPLKRENINVGQAGRTGSHSGQDALIDGSFCFLQIVTGWRGASLPKHPQQELLA